MSDKTWEELTPYEKSLRMYEDRYTNYIHHQWKMSPQEEYEELRDLEDMKAWLDSNKP